MAYGGYDYLAVKTFVKKGTMTHVGNKVGVGKESDIYLVANEDTGKLYILKLQRYKKSLIRRVKNYKR